jgi:precorrin-2 methylase
MTLTMGASAAITFSYVTIPIVNQITSIIISGVTSLSSLSIRFGVALATSEFNVLLMPDIVNIDEIYISVSSKSQHNQFLLLCGSIQ